MGYQTNNNVDYRTDTMLLCTAGEGVSSMVIVGCL